MKLPDGTYNILKWVLCIVIDAFILCLTSIATAWHWDIPLEAITITITAISTFLGTIFGISCYNYNKRAE